MKLSKYIIPALCAALGACSQGNNAAAGEEEHHHHGPADTDHIELSERQVQTVGIELDTLSMRTIGNGIHAAGVLKTDPQASAEISPLVSGTVARICVVEGQQVEAGTVLAYIESPEAITIQQDYLTARAEAAYARSEYERQLALSNAGAGIRRNLDAARSAKEVCQAREDGLRAQLDMLGIDTGALTDGNMSARVAVKSPIRGNVVSISAATGSFADMQTAMMSVSDNSRLYASLRVFEREATRLQPGQKVTMHLTNRPGTTAEGRIEQINPNPDATTRALDVRVRLDSTGGTLAAGMAVNATINTGDTLTETLPSDAITTDGGHSYVFMLKDIHTEPDGDRAYVFERREVIAGAHDDSHTAVRFPEPVDHNAQFVTSGAFYLSSMTSEHAQHAH